MILKTFITMPLSLKNRWTSKLTQGLCCHAIYTAVRPFRISVSTGVFKKRGLLYDLLYK